MIITSRRDVDSFPPEPWISPGHLSVKTGTLSCEINRHFTEKSDEITIERKIHGFKPPSKRATDNDFSTA